MLVIFVGSNAQETETALESMLQASPVPLEVSRTETREFPADGAVTTATYEPWREKVTA